MTISRAYVSRPSFPSRRGTIGLTAALTVAASVLTAGPAALPAVAQEPTTIPAIQGRAHRSPLEGQVVSDVPGIVTVTRNNGFYLQDPAPDGDPATSEALFVFTGGRPGVAVGHRVAVSGTVTEFRPGGSSAPENLTTTEITRPTVRVLDTGGPVPVPTTIGRGGRVPPGEVIEDDASGDVEQPGVPFDPAEDGLDFYESLEGMRVQVVDAVAAGPTNRFEELPVLPDGGAGAGVRSVRGGIVVRPNDFNPERVILDDGPGVSMPLADVGDVLPGAVAGVLDYSFGNVKLVVDAAPAVVRGGLTHEITDPQAATEFAVATMNVENLDARDPAEKFAELAEQVVGNLRAPDVIAVEEIQDDDGSADTAVVSAQQTWQRLVSAIAAAGGPAYDWRSIDPLDDQDGGQPGGNIRVGFLFRTDIDLEFVDRPGGDATTPVRVQEIGTSGKVRLSISPGRIDPGEPAWLDSRKPLVGEFKFRGETVFVVANHWASKGGDNPLFGRVQPPARPTEVQRDAQARVVADFVEELFAVEPGARLVVAGDLNDFEFSTAVRTLTATGLTDLPATLPQPERYTYVFEGNSQVLDHLLLSPSLARLPFAYDIVHVNAEFAAAASDHDPQVVRLPLKRG